MPPLASDAPASRLMARLAGNFTSSIQSLMANAKLAPTCMQVYLRVDAMEQSRPHFLFNYFVSDDDTPWKHVPVAVQHPARLPASLPRGLYLRVTAQRGHSLLKEAVALGAFLTVPQLKSIASELKLAGLQEGSGVKGQVIKVDLARQLVMHLFGGDAEYTQKDREDMISRLVKGKIRSPKKVDTKHEDEAAVLEMVEQLDAENQQCFKEVKEWAGEKLRIKFQKSGEARAHAEQKKAADFARDP